ncbi:MAG: cell division protein FtsW [SAR116 cluster bacterium]|nr:cell division protein FtsW [SAR116 cluster bacterium]
MNFLDRTDRSTLSLWWWTVDHKLIGLILLLIIGGVMLLMSAGSPVAVSKGLGEYHFLKKQLIFLSIAIPLMVFVSLLNAKVIKLLSLLVLFVSFLCLIYINFKGIETNGASRWIRFFGLSIQPSEFVKPSFAVINAWLLSIWVSDVKSKTWLYSVLLLIILLTMLLLQPDVGMSFILASTWLFQLYIVGISIMLVLVTLLAISLIGFSSYFLFEHVQKRVDGFIEGGGFQVGKSLEAFINGGFFGQGFGEGDVSKNLPDSHTDFIFAVAGEELGSFGCGLIIIAYFLIFLRGMIISSTSTKIFLFLTCSAIIFQFCLQALIHMASTLNLIPTKGMTLPFISYGGSSLLSTSIAMGVVLAFTRSQSNKNYE